ncbi:MAG TPA: alpha/beta fold hydrolase, partial [Patescibacteria group bacterium]
FISHPPAPAVPIRPIHPYALEKLISHVSKSQVAIDGILPPTPNFNSYIVSYNSDGNKVFALMEVPKSGKPSRGWPVLVLNHGHIAPDIYSTVNSYKNTSAYFASNGFLVLKPDFRGHDKSTGTIDELVSHSQYAIDVLNLIASLDSIPAADSQRVYLYGHSMGADVSLLVVETGIPLKAVALWAPAVAIYPENLTYFVEKRIVPVPSGRLDKLRQLLAAQTSAYGTLPFSSFQNLSKVKVPLLIQHSPTDTIVPYSWGQDLLTGLQNNNPDVTFTSYPDDDHNLSKHFSAALSQDIDFFNRHP